MGGWVKLIMCNLFRFYSLKYSRTLSPMILEFCGGKAISGIHVCEIERFRGWWAS